MLVGKVKSVFRSGPGGPPGATLASALQDVAASIKAVLTAPDLPSARAALGLGNVANLAPADLPVSSATAAAITALQTALTSYAPLASPALTGTPTAPTATGGANTTQIATCAFVQAALGPYLTSVTAAATYATLASPALTGAPTAPTPTAGDASTKIATTAFVTGALGSYLTTAAATATYAPLSSPALTGSPTAPTATAGDATTKLATTAFVAAAIQAAAAGGTVFPLGQCRLAFSSTTAVKLLPCNGGLILVGGVLRTIPAAGVALSNAGLLATSLPPATTYKPYYVYAKWASGALSLIASTTGHATDATYGIEVKSDDAAATLVGMVALDGTPGSAGTFADSPTKRYTASFYNRRTRDLYAPPVNCNTGSGSYVEVSSALRLIFLCWGDESCGFHLDGAGGTGTAGYYTYTTIGIDGVKAATEVALYSPVGTGQGIVPLNSNYETTLSEGFHYMNFMAYTGSSQGQYTLATVGRTRI